VFVAQNKADDFTLLQATIGGVKVRGHADKFARSTARAGEDVELLNISAYGASHPPARRRKEPARRKKAPRPAANALTP
jgi:hypothetical protein